MLSIARRVIPFATAMLLFFPALASAQLFTPAQQREIKDIVRNYLIQHPEVLQEAVSALNRRREEAAAKQAEAAIEKDSAALFNSPHQVVLGNPHGNVTLVEFFDYNCPYCRQSLPDMLKLMKTDPKLRVVLKEFPVLGPGSVQAADVAVAARMQDPAGTRYLKFHKLLLGGRGEADLASALAAAKEAGFDLARIKRDMNSAEVKTTIAQDMKLADALGINGTPTFVVGDQLMVGAVGYGALKQEIAAARKNHTALQN